MIRLLFIIVTAVLAQPISNTSIFPADFGSPLGMSQGALPCQDIAASVTAPWCRTAAGARWCDSGATRCSDESISCMIRSTFDVYKELIPVDLRTHDAFYRVRTDCRCTAEHISSVHIRTYIIYIYTYIHM